MPPEKTVANFPLPPLVIVGESDRQPIAPEHSGENSYQLTQVAVLAADDRKATNVVILAVGQASDLADYFAVMTGQSRAQVRAIAGSVRDRVEAELGRLPLRVSGEREGSWVLMDYGDVLVHILLPQERSFYNLEAFWGHVPRYVLASP